MRERRTWEPNAAWEFHVANEKWSKSVKRAVAERAEGEKVDENQDEALESGKEDFEEDEGEEDRGEDEEEEEEEVESGVEDEERGEVVEIDDAMDGETIEAQRREGREAKEPPIAPGGSAKP